MDGFSLVTGAPALRGTLMMKYNLPYPFDIEYLKRNKAFMLFCPPDVLDEEQRPVLEGRSLLYTLDKSDFQVCPYTDSRGISGKPINIESLKALSRNQDAVVSFIKSVGQYVAQQFSDGIVEPDLSNLYAVSYVGYRAPTLNFANKLFDEKCEVFAACSVSSRFYHGLLNMLALVALEHDGNLVGIRMSAEELYQYANDHGHLMGAEESCAASKATIVKYLSLSLQSCRATSCPTESDANSSVQSEVICRFAKITMELEFSSLVYEAMRCWFWRQTPGSEGVSVDQRYATRHCLLAKKLSLVADPFEHKLFKRAERFLMTFGSVDPEIKELVTLASESVRVSQQDSESRAITHQRLKVKMLGIFAKKAEFIELHVVGGSFLSSDLDIFFGQWPD